MTHGFFEIMFVEFDKKLNFQKSRSSDVLVLTLRTVLVRNSLKSSTSDVLLFRSRPKNRRARSKARPWTFFKNQNFVVLTVLIITVLVHIVPFPSCGGRIQLPG